MIQRACMFALVALALTIGLTYADNPSPLLEYSRTVDQVLTLVERAATEPNLATRQSLLEQATARLSVIHAVQADSGEQWLVNNDQLLADLNASVSDARSADRLQNIAVRLRTLRAALDAPPVAANESERAQLRDILAQPPFNAGDNTNQLDSLFNQLADWLGHFLNGTAAGIVSLRYGIAILGFVFVVGVLIFFLRTLMSNWVVETQLTASVEGADLTSGNALIQAQRLANEGDYRTAVRQLYLATLLLLDERGVLRYDRALTNREYLSAVKNEPKILSALEPIVDTFDRTWYGFESVKQEEFELYRQRVEALREL